VQSHAGAISLLNALPPSWAAGSIADIRCRGGHRVSLSWREGRFDGAAIVGGVSGPLTLELPSGNYAVTGASDQAIPAELAEGAPGRTRLTWQASSGARYTITARSAI
jgi:alpha-L-fucosidase 2